MSELFAVLANLTQQLFELYGSLWVVLVSNQPVSVHLALTLHRVHTPRMRNLRKYALN